MKIRPAFPDDGYSQRGTSRHDYFAAKLKWKKINATCSESRAVDHLRPYRIAHLAKDSYRLTGPYGLAANFQTQRDCRLLAQAHCDLLFG